MSENKEGRNLEEINRKKILNFGNLSGKQYERAAIRGHKGVGWDEAWIKCRRCSERRKVKWESNIQAWDINSGFKSEEWWKVYLYKSQVEKVKNSYQITGNIEFYCSKCDLHHNYW